MHAPGLHPLHADLLGRWAAGPTPTDPWLASLLARACANEGEVMRLSARRVVLRLDAAGETWLLKLDAPRRAWEAMRSALRAGPALREGRNARRLAAELSGFPRQIHAEEPAAGFGLFARPWLSGVSAAAVCEQEGEAIGAGLARLHAAGWTDPDLSAGDLILPAAGGLLPVDLGHARVRRRGATSEARRTADLTRLLASLPRARARAAAPAICSGYQRTATLPLAASELARAADALRRRLLQRHSRRCLRPCSDFALDDGILRRREAPPGVRLEWHETSPRRARAAFRALYELELHGLRAARPAECAGARVVAYAPLARAAGPADDEALLDLGAAFAAAGYGLDLQSAADFGVDEAGRAWLLRPTALLGPLR